MTLRRLIELGGKALTKPPRHTLRRLGEEAANVLWRPWASVRPRVFRDRQLLAAVGAVSIDAFWDERAHGAYFLAPACRDAWAEAFRTRWPDAQAEIVAAADRGLAHEFDLLGSGPLALGPRLPWHEDFKTGRVWPLQYSPDIEFSELDKPTDVKVPWELSRCQHFGVLGQAYWLTGDERYAQEYVDQVSDWIERNPLGRGVNWITAMDVSLRAVSWIWGFYFFAGSRACANEAFRSRLLRSLYLHGEWVASHMEKGSVNGNHYLSDGVGLVFLGTFFKASPHARAWLDTGRALVLDEMLLQVEEDGVDFEASTAYHRLVMELFLTAYLLLRLNGETIPDAQWTRLERMCEFVEAYVKPDGLAPLVGDADDGRVQILGRQQIGDHRYLLSTGAVLFGRGDFKRAAGGFHEESFWMLGPEAARQFDGLAAPTRAPISKAFPSGGYFVLRDGATHVFIDCASVGMRGIGGHGHNDILSFELVLDGLPLVTDCGAYLYTAAKEWRNRFRSTSFHSTIQVDNEELNQFIGPDALWQLRDDATPDGVSFRLEPRCDRFRGAHLGYRRLPSPVRVQREIVLATGRSFVVVSDTVEGAAQHQVTRRFHLPAGLEPTIEGQDIRLSKDGQERWLLPVSGMGDLQWVIESGWVSPSYGVRHETRVLVVRGHLQLPHRLTVMFSSRRGVAAARLTDARSVGLE